MVVAAQFEATAAHEAQAMASAGEATMFWGAWKEEGRAGRFEVNACDRREALTRWKPM